MKDEDRTGRQLARTLEDSTASLKVKGKLRGSQSKGRHGAVKPQPGVVPGDAKMKAQYHPSSPVALTAAKLISQLFTDECECSRKLGLMKRQKKKNC